MSNKNKKLGLGIAAVAAAGAGLVYAAQKTSQQKVKKIRQHGQMPGSAKAFIIHILPGQRKPGVDGKMHGRWCL